MQGGGTAPQGRDALRFGILRVEEQVVVGMTESLGKADTSTG